MQECMCCRQLAVSLLSPLNFSLLNVNYQRFGAAACGRRWLAAGGHVSGRRRQRRRQQREFPRQLEVAAAAPPPRVPARAQRPPALLLIDKRTKGRAGAGPGTRLEPAWETRRARPGRSGSRNPPRTRGTGTAASAPSATAPRPSSA